jgi:acid phosphatase
MAVAPATLPTSVTASDAPPFSFVVLGDWGSGSAEQRYVADALGRVAASHAARFVISTGDNFYPRGVASVTDPHWNTVFEEVYANQSLQVPWLIALGNHDHRGSVAAQIDYGRKNKRWHLPAPFYRHGERLADGTGVDFFFLDTTPLYNAARWPWKLWPFENEQYGWLKRELAASEAEWKIVVGHHPILSGGGHGSTAVLLGKLRPLIEEYGVNAYFNGHNHGLEHIALTGVHYLTVGAGSDAVMPRSIQGSIFSIGIPGFMAVTVHRDEMRIEFFNDNGHAIYRTNIARLRKIRSGH